MFGKTEKYRNKNIIILNGSSRPNGNTAELVNAFKKGAESVGSTGIVFQLNQMEIRPCLGCYRYGNGRPKDHPCVQADDMDEIYKIFREADVIAFASPLYFWQLSGPIITTINRFLAIAECDNAFSTKDAVLLMAAEGRDFSDAKGYYEGLIRRIGWENRGEVLASGVRNIGDLRGKKSLLDAEKLGASL
jgi:Multimeric flavodoxin WrbA